MGTLLSVQSLCGLIQHLGCTDRCVEIVEVTVVIVVVESCYSCKLWDVCQLFTSTQSLTQIASVTIRLLGEKVQRHNCP